MKPTVLVTGASGFVGLNVLRRALAEPRTVVGLSAAPIADDVATSLRDLPGTFVEAVGDVRDHLLLDRLFESHRIDRVLHMAAITADEGRERVAADTILSVNLAGLAVAMQAAARAGVGRFVTTSSVAVWGGETADGSIVDEDVPHRPKTLYAITKSTAEAVTARLGAVLGLDWIVARLGRVFGPDEYPTGVRDTLSQIHQVSVCALAGRAVSFDRPCRKNWSFAPDVATRLLTLIDAPTHDARTYNLGSADAWSLADWCALLRHRLPAFRYRVGGALPHAVSIDLGGARDGGLLSWQRFEREFGVHGDTALPDAFEATLRSMGRRAASPRTEAA